MEKYILYTGEIEGKYREIQIYPLNYSNYEYLIHWDGFEVGVIKKIDSKWYTETEELSSVLNELGSFIDENGVSPDY
ncbi:hypothetical protein SAMN06265348_110282 [Pedobacter westerhofensis]|uniref:Uncharacterized protein n=1 Tax=Pedobacter westerhofensis TaxID=425512 RepID=A0A521F9Z5_9SPHI|nr:hypothetical protein [Pedobacter westerhofensis]SMO92320.1 hypothetical protein SAMN06265348_110282 [Pedobacter westerhofensis]